MNDGKLSISIVTPTDGRVSLVEDLLSSLASERITYAYGKTEVIIVNSGDENNSRQIESLCQKYDAVFIEGDKSVRKKRNLGIKAAQYEVILFLDSDVTAQEGLLKRHAETYLNATEANLVGSFGFTEFVGEKTLWWKVIAQTTYLDSFSFAKKSPYQSWTIGNNLSLYKHTIEEVGGFEENFPFPLGGDDLDLTYRITKFGYLIKSTPDAVALHSTETWNKPKNIRDRTRRWGSMEYYIQKRHPEIFVDCIPKSDVLFFCSFVAATIVSIMFLSISPLAFTLMWFLIFVICVYVYDLIHQEGGAIVPYVLGKIIRVFYRLYYEREGLRHRDFRCLHKEMSFSLNQTKFMQRRETGVLGIFLLTYVVAFMVFIYVIW